jgi:hypothetical protein
VIHLCRRCDRLIKDGERVSVKVESTYHVLKSSIAFALDKHDLEASSDTLEHVHCSEGD